MKTQIYWSRQIYYYSGYGINARTYCIDGPPLNVDVNEIKREKSLVTDHEMSSYKGGEGDVERWLIIAGRWNTTRNLEEINVSKLDLRKDGKATWTRENSTHSSSKVGGTERFSVRYEAGPKELEWFEEEDVKYLKELEREDKLKECERAVWYLREQEHARELDIGDWWKQKLQLRNIELILKKAEIKGLVADVKEIVQRAGNIENLLQLFEARERPDLAKSDALVGDIEPAVLNEEVLPQNISLFTELLRKIEPRAKLRALIESTQKALLSIKEGSNLLSLAPAEQTELLKIAEDVNALSISAMDSATVAKSAVLVESKLKQLRVLTQRLDLILAEKAKQEERRVEARAKLRTLIERTQKVLLPIKEGDNLLLFAPSVQTELLKFAEDINALSNSTMVDATVEKGKELVESKQEQLWDLTQRLVLMLAEKAKQAERHIKELKELMAEQANAQLKTASPSQTERSALKEKLQSLVIKTLLSLPSESQLQLLPSQEQLDLRGLQEMLKQLDISSLNEEGLTKNIMLFEGRQQYLSSLPQKLAALAEPTFIGRIIALFFGGRSQSSSEKPVAPIDAVATIQLPGAPVHDVAPLASNPNGFFAGSSANQQQQASATDVVVEAPSFK